MPYSKAQRLLTSSQFVEYIEYLDEVDWKVKKAEHYYLAQLALHIILAFGDPEKNPQLKDLTVEKLMFDFTTVADAAAKERDEDEQSEDADSENENDSPSAPTDEDLERMAASKAAWKTSMRKNGASDVAAHNRKMMKQLEERRAARRKRGAT